MNFVKLMVVLIISMNQAFALCEPAEPEAPPTTFQEFVTVLHKHLKCVRTDIVDGSTNEDSVYRIGILLPIIKAAANAPVPATPASNVVIASIGIEEATLKYKSLVEATRISLLELQSILKAKGNETCGKTCDSLLGQVHSLQVLGHQSFRFGYEVQAY